MEVAQRHEVVLDVLDAGFYPAFLLRITRRARRDDKTVAERAFAIGALDLRLVVAGAGDRALGVIDRNFFGHAVEPLEGAAMTSQPSLHLLVADDLGVLVPTPRQRHHEDPGLDDLAGRAIGNHRSLAEVDLGGIGHREVEHDRRRRRHRRRLLQKAVHAMHAAGKAVDARQRLADGGDLDALRMPAQDLVAKRLDARHVRRRRARDFEKGGELGVIGHWARRLKPALCPCQLPDVRYLGAPDALGAGHLTIGSAEAQPKQHLPILVHLEPPVGHRVSLPPAKSREANAQQEVRNQ